MRPLRDEITVVGLLNSLKHSETAVRRQAVRALGRQLLDTAVVLRQLGRALDDSDTTVRVAAAQGLARRGAAAVPLLTDALDNADRDVRREAVWALARLGPGAESAVTALARAVTDADRKVAQGAVRALGGIGPAAAPAIRRLVGILTGSHFVDARQAAWALARIGADSVPELLRVIQAGDLYARGEAAWALTQMGPAARQAVPVLAELLRGRGLFGTTKHPGPVTEDGDSTAPVLIRPRHGTEDAFWIAVITALAEIGPDAAEAVPVLLQLRQTGYGTMQVLAARALARIDPAA